MNAYRMNEEISLYYYSILHHALCFLFSPLSFNTNIATTVHPIIIQPFFSPVTSLI